MKTDKIIEVLELIESDLQNEKATTALGKLTFLKNELQREDMFIELKGGKS